MLPGLLKTFPFNVTPFTPLMLIARTLTYKAGQDWQGGDDQDSYSKHRGNSGHFSCFRGMLQQHVPKSRLTVDGTSAWGETWSSRLLQIGPAHHSSLVATVRVERPSTREIVTVPSVVLLDRSTIDARNQHKQRQTSRGKEQMPH